MLASDRELPVAGGPEKRAYVRAVFSAIAPTYDRLNRIISLRLDQRWRRCAVDRLGWEHKPDGIYLDLCAGTLDLAATLARRPGFRGRILGADFVPRMLGLGSQKAPGITPVAADALALPFPDRSFDGAMVAWGLRNLVDLDAGIREAGRVLKPGCCFVILETARPGQHLFGRVMECYLRHALPRIGRWISRHQTAYTWLSESTAAFLPPAELARRLEGQGFRDVSYILLMGGLCAVYVGTSA